MKRSFTQNNSQMRRMYRISTYIWFKFIVNVGNYLIHGPYGIHLTWTPNKNSESNERCTSLQIFDGPRGTQLAAITERHVRKPKKNHVWNPKKNKGTKKNSLQPIEPWKKTYNPQNFWVVFHPLYILTNPPKPQPLKVVTDRGSWPINKPWHKKIPKPNQGVSTTYLGMAGPLGKTPGLKVVKLFLWGPHSSNPTINHQLKGAIL